MIVYSVTNKFGTEGLYTEEDLLEYCKSWWDGVENQVGPLEECDSVVETYFEHHPEEYYNEFYIDKDFLKRLGV